jgi:hypothetical protein
MATPVEDDPNMGTCRCCRQRATIGRWGLCVACAAAVERFIATRRIQLHKRAVITVGAS